MCRVQKSATAPKAVVSVHHAIKPLASSTVPVSTTKVLIGETKHHEAATPHLTKKDSHETDDTILSDESYESEAKLTEEVAQLLDSIQLDLEFLQLPVGGIIELPRHFLDGQDDALAQNLAAFKGPKLTLKPRFSLPQESQPKDPPEPEDSSDWKGLPLWEIKCSATRGYETPLAMTHGGPFLVATPGSPHPLRPTLDHVMSIPDALWMPGF